MLLTNFALSILTASIPSITAAPISSPADATLSKRLLGTVAGPKIGGANFPDPSIIYTDQWYAFATRTIGSSIHVQVATSTDFETWSIVTNSDGTQLDALPDLPAWVVTGSGSNTWAPDVSVLDDGSYVLYFAASTTEDSTKHCVGAATSTSVTGPYTAQDTALFCPLSEGGAIDADGYNDNGQRYIVYKVDGNSIGHGGACGNTVAPIVATPIILQAVEADGLTLQGAPTTILNNDGAADDGIVEGPSIVGYDGTYYLFFSSGCFTDSTYTVSYATASAITGPYTRASNSPLLSSSNSGLTAPGGADVTKDGEKLVFHANDGSGRALYTALISEAAGIVSI